MYFPGPEGPMNQLVHFLSLGKIGPLEWLRNENLALPAIMILSIWHGVGLQMALFLAGLQEIPTHLYEAALIDGANGIQQFRYVTLPQLRNTLIYVLVTGTILAFRLFTPVDLLTAGGPFYATTTMIYLTYKHGFQLLRLGHASAITIILSIIILLIAWLQRHLLQRDTVTE
jgi:multiple sugar transport system permease protein